MELTLRKDHNFNLGPVECEMCIRYLSVIVCVCFEGKLGHTGWPVRYMEGQGQGQKKGRNRTQGGDRLPFCI